MTHLDYRNLKVNDLRDLLTARSLPITGKKEELIQRLQDAEKPKITSSDLGDLAPPDEDVDWDDDNAISTGKESMGAKKSEEPKEVDTSAVNSPVTAAIKKEAGVKKKDEATKQEIIKTSIEQEKEVNNSIANSQITKEEHEKRLARAKRFGLTTEYDAKKRNARVARFGNSNQNASKKPSVDKKRKNELDHAPIRSAEDEEKAQKRAIRFGASNNKNES